MTVELFDVRDADRLKDALELRFEVFVREQGVPPDEEVDAHDRDDPDAVHALIRAEGIALATGRFYRRVDGAVQIGRMAVAPGARGRGLGRSVLEALLAEARRRGYERARLDAQLTAVAFYRRAGFEACGEEFLDAGILHRAMERRILI